MARRVAHTVLLEVAEASAFATQALARIFERHGVPADERPLATELTLGVLRHATTLTRLLDAQLKKPLVTLPHAVRAALHIGAYQLFFLRMPPHSAVSQAVALISRRHGALLGVANAVLRQLARSDRERILQEANETKGLASAQALAQHCGLPAFWLSEMWQRLGPEDTVALAEAHRERPKTSLRVNTTRTTRQALMDRLRSRGLAPSPSKVSPDGIALSQTGSIRLLPGFAEGHFSVQDMEATLPVRLAALRPDAKVLDMCAAPGGKTTQMAEQLSGGHVVACDRYAHRTALLEDNLARLGLVKQVSLLTLDATDTAALAAGMAEVGCPAAELSCIVLDAPCSGLGTLRRHPELRRRTEAEQQAVVALQQRLLETAAALLPPGAALIYSVCTTTLSEGRHQVRDFLQRHPHYVLRPVAEVAPELAPYIADTFYVETWPHRDQLDGFFAVRIERRDDA